MRQAATLLPNFFVYFILRLNFGSARDKNRAISRNRTCTIPRDIKKLLDAGQQILYRVNRRQLQTSMVCNGSRVAAYR